MTEDANLETATQKTPTRSNFNFLINKKDIRIMILGADGSGKTVLMHYLAEQFYKAGHKIKFLAPQTIIRQKITPDWMELQFWKFPTFDRNKMHLIDDTQLQAHAREHWKKRNINYAKIMTVARHRHAAVIITTQQGADIDNKLLAKAHVILFKKPTFLAAETERPFLRKLSKQIRKLFREDIESKGLNPQEWTYCISDLYQGWVGPNGLPSYWSDELGDW